MAYLSFWIVTVALTGVLCGFYLSHALLFGRFVDWLVTTGRGSVLWETFPEFRAAHPPLAYYSIIVAQSLATVGFAGFSIFKRAGVCNALLAAGCSILLAAIHVGSGFRRLELDVLLGTQRSKPALARFASWDVKFHFACALLMLSGFVALCTLSGRGAMY